MRRSYRLFHVSLFLLCLALTAAPASAQLTSRVLVTDPTTSEVTIIDSATDALLDTLAIGSAPPPAAVTADGRRAYIADAVTNTVSVLDLSTHVLVATIPLPPTTPNAVAITPDGREVLVGSRAGGGVIRIDTATDTVVGSYAAGTEVTGLAFSPDGSTLYVSDWGNRNILRVVLATGSLASSIALASAPLSMAVAPALSRGYVGEFANAITVFNTNTAAIVTTIPLTGTFEHLALAADRRVLYVTTSTPHAIVPIDLDTNTVGTVVPLPFDPAGIALSADGTLLYVASPGSVSIFDAATLVATPAAWSTGPSPSTISVGPLLIVPSATPLTVSDDAGLASRGVANDLNFMGGTLTVTGGAFGTGRPVNVWPDSGTIDVADGLATFSGVISGDGMLIKTGPGVLSSSGSIALPGGLQIVRGQVEVLGTATGTIAVGPEGKLTGTGTVDVITGTGTVRPGLSLAGGPGQMLTAAQATLSTLEILVGDGGLGFGCSTLNVTGQATLTGATLSVIDTGTLPPTPGFTCTIVTNATGTFANLPEGAPIVAGHANFRISYVGGSGHDVVLTAAADLPPTLTAFAPLSLPVDATIPPIAFSASDDFTEPGSLFITVSSSNQSLVADSNITIAGNTSGTLTIVPWPGAYGQTTITVNVADGMAQLTSQSFVLTVGEPAKTYYLAEGASNTFFTTELVLANPSPTLADVTVRFLKETGETITRDVTLSGYSRYTLPSWAVEGLESAVFSTEVISPSGRPIIVERTMWWDATGYGAHTEKASDGPSPTWYFAEGAQGFFSTFFLLVNPHSTANVAHVTYYREGGTPLVRSYPVDPHARFTIDVNADEELAMRSFAAEIVFDQPAMAERAMYFGADPLFSGGSGSAGATAPAAQWAFAEGATSSYFSTFLLAMNPHDEEARVTAEYLLDLGGGVITTTHTIPPHGRLTIDVAGEHPRLAAAAFSAILTANHPIVAERSMYWPKDAWIESHNSPGLTAASRRWGLAEGRVGGFGEAQTYILLANPATNTAPAEVTITFLRTSGDPLVKTFTVPVGTRFNVAVIGTGDGSDVKEFENEEFGAIIDSTQPILVERSLYTNVDGVTWAAGTNATGMPLPPVQP